MPLPRQWEAAGRTTAAAPGYRAWSWDALPYGCIHNSLMPSPPATACYRRGDDVAARRRWPRPLPRCHQNAATAARAPFRISNNSNAMGSCSCVAATAWGDDMQDKIETTSWRPRRV
uniref:Uncharacterized protein n=1 Tax=Oryza rufipogon TaxID=4529 RepID=A0A0E0QM40_ORYRU